MADKIYPKEPTKTVRIPKQGYNSVSLVKETDTDWEYELYNPNIKPQEVKPATPEEDEE